MQVGTPQMPHGTTPVEPCRRGAYTDRSSKAIDGLSVHFPFPIDPIRDMAGSVSSLSPFTHPRPPVAQSHGICCSLLPPFSMQTAVKTQFSQARATVRASRGPGARGSP